MNNKPFKAVDGPMIMLIAFLSMIALQFVFGIVLLPFMTLGIDTEILNYVAMFFFQGAYILTFIIYTKKKKIKSTFSPRNKITVWAVLAGICFAVISFFCFIGPAYLFEYLLGFTGYVGEGMEVSSTLSLILIIASTVIVAPICEETIFRNAFLSGISKVRNDDLGMSLLSGICFALMHINPSQTVYQFLLGFASAYLMLKCRSVLPSMLIHGVSNGLALLMDFTAVGRAIDAFYAKTTSDFLIGGLTCVVLPACGFALIWLIGKFLSKAEKRKYPEKFMTPKIIWIDERTKEPIYEGGEVPVIDDGNRTFQRGFSPFTGAPVMVDRLELQRALREDYARNNGEKSGRWGQNSYRTAFVIYFIVTCFMWLLTFVTNILNGIILN